MNLPQNTILSEIPDWDACYREGTPPWDSGVPSGELVRVLDEGLVRPGTTLELGCGTGADAVHLAQQGFEMTAVDSSPMAIERARTRAELSDTMLRFVLDDVFQFVKSSETFDLVYDAGFYHFIRRTNLDRLLDLLWRVTRPGSYYLVLAGSDRATCSGGPPQVTKTQIHNELGRLFEFVHLRPFYFESSQNDQRYPGWSCLAKRPEPIG